MADKITEAMAAWLSELEVASPTQAHQDEHCPVCASVVPFGVQAFEDAVHLLLCWPNTSLEPVHVFGGVYETADWGMEMVVPMALELRKRAVMHLQRRLEMEFGGRSIRSRIASEDAAMDLIRGLGRSLVTASKALDEAARRLRDNSGGVHAAEAKKAATAAREIGERVLV